MKNKKAQFGKLAGLIPVILIMILGIIVLSKVGGEELSIVNKLWGGSEGGPVLGSKTVVEIKPARGYDFDIGLPDGISVVYFTESRRIDLYHTGYSDILSPHGDDLASNTDTKSALVGVSAELKEELGDTEKLIDVDCTSLPPDVTQYKDVTETKNTLSQLEFGDIICVKTDKGHIVKVKVRSSGEHISSWTSYFAGLTEEERQMFDHGEFEIDVPEKGPTIEWWFQLLNYEPGRSDMETGDEILGVENEVSFQREVMVLGKTCQICSGYLTKADCEACYQAGGHNKLDPRGEPRDDNCYCDNGDIIDSSHGGVCYNSHKYGELCEIDAECDAVKEECIDTKPSLLSGWKNEYGLTGSWFGIDFDKPKGTAVYPDADYDVWYSKEHGILFDSGLRKVTDGVEIHSEPYSNLQRGLYIGGEGQADNIFCDKLTPLLYYPRNDEVSYIPPIYDDAYYCIITSENRVVKLHWLTEIGEEPAFEWWYES